MNSPLEWTDNCRLGYEPLDAIHEDFVNIVARLQAAPDVQLPALLDEFIAHARAHFEEENQWMRETDFPPRDCHIEQHDAVLASTLEVRQRLAQGDHGICRSLAQALADWFPSHATHLDSALAHWMFKRRFGGKPVVIHRGVHALSVATGQAR